MEASRHPMLVDQSTILKEVESLSALLNRDGKETGYRQCSEKLEQHPLLLENALYTTPKIIEHTSRIIHRVRKRVSQKREENKVCLRNSNGYFKRIDSFLFQLASQLSERDLTLLFSPEERNFYERLRDYFSNTALESAPQTPYIPQWLNENIHPRESEELVAGAITLARRSPVSIVASKENIKRMIKYFWRNREILAPANEVYPLSLYDPSSYRLILSIGTRSESSFMPPKEREASNSQNQYSQQSSQLVQQYTS